MKNKNGKMIVLEGISGSGKSTIIDLLQQELKISNVENWFDNQYTRRAMDIVEEYIHFNHDVWACLYYIDFAGKYNYYLKELLSKGKTILFHRYLYTPLVHDKMRKANKELVDSLYNCDDIQEPDLIIYLEVLPKVALNRIRKDRKPTFYECGLDVIFENNILEAKKKYNCSEYSDDFLDESFMSFQEKVCSEYKNILKNKNNVVFLSDDISLNKKKEIVINLISKLKIERQVGK